MNKYDFTNIINNKLALTHADADALKHVVEKYPWFATAQVLLAKALLQQQSAEYENQLKKAAIYIGNRNVLYNIINDIPLITLQNNLSENAQQTNLKEYKIVEAQTSDIVSPTNETKTEQIDVNAETETPETEIKEELKPEIKIQTPALEIQTPVIEIEPEIKEENDEIVQLVDTDGHLIMYKSVETETNDIEQEDSTETTETFDKNLEDEILTGFDISSIEPTNATTLYDEIESSNKSIDDESKIISSLDTISISNTENTTENKPVDEKLPETDKEFLTWLNKTTDVVIEEVKEKNVEIKHPDDLKLISTIEIKLSDEAKIKISDEIKNTIIHENHSIIEAEKIFTEPETTLSNENNITEKESVNIVSEKSDDTKAVEILNSENFEFFKFQPFEFEPDTDFVSYHENEYDIGSIKNLNETQSNDIIDFDTSFNETFRIITDDKQYQESDKPNSETNISTRFDNDKKQNSILEKFIRENPSISRPKSEFYNPLNMAKMSVEEDEELVSETLARIYEKQALYKKAIAIYEKLGLLYPNKKTYFAALIENLKTKF